MASVLPILPFRNSKAMDDEFMDATMHINAFGLSAGAMVWRDSPLNYFDDILSFTCFFSCL